MQMMFKFDNIFFLSSYTAADQNGEVVMLDSKRCTAGQV